jgi:hypothetical protein
MIELGDLNQHITIIEVDYSQLYCIKNKDTEYDGFDKYYNKKMTSFLKQYRTKITNQPTKSDLFPEYDDYSFQYYVVKWFKLYKKYNGFCLFPFREPKYNLDLNKKKKMIITEFPAGWDVSSLVLWNKKSIIKHYNLGKIKDIIKKKTNTPNTSNTSNTSKSKQKQLLIDNIIKKIKQINKSS